MFVSSIFIAGFIVMPLDVSVRSNFTIVPWNYFINVNYASFVTEISFSILFILPFCLYYLSEEKDTKSETD